MKKTGYKLIKTALPCLTLIVCLSGCAKEVECDINGNHVHLYTNQDMKLSRYINSEKEYVGNLFRTENYLPMTEDLESITENKLYNIKDNTEYLEEVISSYHPERQAYIYDYIYGNYYGYDYGYNFSNNKYEYFYGNHTGYHWDYEWQNISLNEYTDDKVRDITYQYRFYKLNADGTTSEKLFNSLDEVTPEYKYFTPTTLVQKNISESYYLTKENTKIK